MISSTDEWELTAGGMYHECYLKEAYTDDNTDANVDAASCMENKYVNWASSDAVWHGQSGPSANCNPPLENACSGLIGMESVRNASSAHSCRHMRERLYVSIDQSLVSSSLTPSRHTSLRRPGG